MSQYRYGGSRHRGGNHRIQQTRGGKWHWRFRQISHYVRPGSVRGGATSTDPALRCLAFEQGGKVALGVINAAQLQA